MTDKPQGRVNCGADDHDTKDCARLPAFTMVRTDTVNWLLGESDSFECPESQYFRGAPTPYFWRKQLREAIAVDGVPDGYVLVPVEPTEDMIIAFAEAWYSKRQAYDDPDMLDAYKDMLAVSPAPEVQQAERQELAETCRKLRK